MNRGHVSLTFFLFALLSSVVSTAQQPEAAPGNGFSSTAAEITSTETIVVTAPGEFRAEQSLETPMLIEQAPGISPIKSLAQLPSVNFEAADPYGSYEWAVRISVADSIRTSFGFR